MWPDLELQPVVGFRVWRTRGEPWLHSLATGTRWEPGPLEAGCRYRASLGLKALHLPGERAPVQRCQCGIYSLGSLEAARHYRDSWQEEVRGQLVLGAILLWGRTLIAQVEDPAGGSEPRLRYRSEYAQVIALVRDTPSAEEIAGRLRIPAVPEAYLEPCARELGQQLWPADSTWARS